MEEQEKGDSHQENRADVCGAILCDADSDGCVIIHCLEVSEEPNSRSLGAERLPGPSTVVLQVSVLVHCGAVVALVQA
jgi:hypothetical protein